MPPKSKYLSSPVLQIFIGCLILLAVRIPFLIPGLGADMDTWCVANVASYLARTGIYSVSRAPGYPLFELACALLIHQSHWFLNLLTCLFSLAAFVLFTLILRRLGHKDWLICGTAFAMTPVIYINSVNFMDYLWALAFLLGAMVCILNSTILPAGILVGLAASCRHTSIVFLVPFLMMMWTCGRERFFRRALWLVVPAVLIQLAFFSLPLLTYGPDLLKVSNGNYQRTFVRIAHKALVGVWGWLGFLAMLGALCTLLIPHARRAIYTAPVPRNLILYPSLFIIGVHYLIYSFLPHEAGYLIPTVPFVLMTLSLILDRRVFLILCLCLMASPFVDVRPYINYGPIIRDHQTREFNDSLMKTVMELIKTDPEKVVLVVGHLTPQMKYYLEDQPENLVLEYTLMPEERDLYLSEGYRILYVPGERELHQRVQGYDLEAYGAKVLEVNDSPH